MPGCATAIRPVLIVGLLTILAAGCRFPDTCDPYPGPDPQAAASTASWASRTSCALSVRVLGRTYTPKPDLIVTDAGDPIDGVRLPACNDVGTSNDPPRADKGRLVTAFAFGTYCTTDVIAVELTEGDQLMLFQSDSSREAATS